MMGGLAMKARQTIQRTRKQKANEEDERSRCEEKENIFENHFRSGEEENKRRMVNNVIEDMRVYYGYLVCLDLA